MATENILTVILILKEILLIFLIAQVVKNQPPKQETQIRSLGQEDPLGEEMATHSSVLAREIPRTEEPGGATVHGVAELDMTEHTHTFNIMPVTIKFTIRFLVSTLYKIKKFA